MRTLKDLEDEILKNNCRHNSMTHVLEILKSSQYKTLVEFGTIRSIGTTHEGYSTLLFAALSREYSKSFISVELDPKCIEISKSLISTYDDDLINYINYMNKDLYDFIKEYDKDNLDFIYIDANSSTGKNTVLKTLMENFKYLSKEAIILIDDMESSVEQTNLCIDIINDCPYLTPIEKKDLFAYNEIEQNFNKTLISRPYKNNTIKFSSGIHQYPYQILLQYKKES